MAVHANGITTNARRISFKQSFAHLTLAALLLLGHSSAFAQTYELSQLPPDIQTKVSILEDKTGKTSIEQIRSNHYKPYFHKSVDSILDFGFTESAYWLTLSLKNSSDSTNHRILELNWPTLTDVDFYLFENQSLLKKIQTGTKELTSTQNITGTAFAFEIKLPPHASQEIYLRIQSDHEIRIPLSLTTPSDFHSSQRNQLAYLFLFCGILIALIIYNLAVSVALKVKSYLVAALCITAFLLGVLAYRGVLREVLGDFPNTQIMSGSFHFYFCIGITLYLIFARKFLQIDTILTGYNKFFIALAILGGSIAFLSFFLKPSVSSEFLHFLGAVTALSSFIASWKLHRLHHRYALNLICAWTIFSLAIVSGLFASNDWLDLGGIAPSFELGIVGFFLALSFGTIEKLSSNTGETDIAKAQAIQEYQRYASEAARREFLEKENVQLAGAIHDATDQLDTIKEKYSETNDSLTEATEHLVNAEKMASLGQMLASISNSMNNPITFISATNFNIREYLEHMETFLLDKVPDAPEANPFREEIQKRFGHLSELTHHVDIALDSVRDINLALENYCNPDDYATDEVNLLTIKGEVLTILAARTKIYEIEEFTDEPPLITCHRSHIAQVMINLILNACEAIDRKKSRVSDVTQKFDDIPGKLLLSLQEKNHGDKNGILFTIEDNGEGIPPEIKNRVLEPFFTTKPTGHGAGLGLPISRTIVTKHNGVLAISDSETLGGAKISVWLPDSLEANADV